MLSTNKILFFLLIPIITASCYKTTKSISDLNSFIAYQKNYKSSNNKNKNCILQTHDTIKNLDFLSNFNKIISSHNNVNLIGILSVNNNKIALLKDSSQSYIVSKGNITPAGKVINILNQKICLQNIGPYLTANNSSCIDLHHE
jgi:hypothetical protein